METPLIPQNDSDSRPPAIFGAVAWSWLILSGLGLIFNILSLATLPTEQTVQHILSQLGLWDPTFQGYLERILRWAGPFTYSQVILSAAATWASWAFLKRKNWGRLALALLNWLMTAAVGLMMASSFYLIKLVRQVPPEDLQAAGLAPAIPFVLGGMLVFCTILLIAPLVWMGWYFHSETVRRYMYVDK